MTNHYEQCIASLENQIKSREEERIKLIEAIEGLEKQLHQTNNRYQNVFRDCEQMAADIHFLEDKVRTQEAALNDNKRVISNLNILNRQATENTNIFKNENARLAKSEAGLTVQLKKLNEEKVKVEKQLSESVARCFQKLGIAQSEIETLKQENAQLAQQLRVKQQQVTELKESVNGLNKDKVAFQNEITRVNKLNNEQADVLRKRQIGLQLANQERQRLERNLSEFKTSSYKKDESTQQLLKRIDDAEKATSKLMGEKLVLTQTIKDANQKCNVYQQSVQALKKELHQSNDHIIQLQKDRNALTLRLAESKKQNDQLTNEREKLQSLLESVRKKNQELSTTGGNLGSELGQYRDAVKDLQQQKSELQTIVHQKEVEISEAQKRAVKEKEGSRVAIEGLQQKIKTLQTAISEHEQRYQLLSKTNKKTIEQLERKLKIANKQIEQKSYHFSGESSKLQTLYRQLQLESSQRIAQLEETCERQSNQIQNLESELLMTQQSIKSNEEFEREKEEMLEKYAQSETTLREIVESIKVSLMEKEQQIQALEQANSTLRQHNFKLIETEGEIRRQYSDLKSRLNEPNRTRNKRNTYVQPGTDRQDSAFNIRDTANSTRTKLKSMHMNLQSYSQRNSQTNIELI